MLDVDAVQCSDAVNYRHRTLLTVVAAAAAVLRLAVHCGRYRAIWTRSLHRNERRQ